MEIILNGKKISAHASTVEELVQQMGFAEKRIAVEINAAIIPRGLYAKTLLQPSDRIEIVQAIGGG